MRKYRVTFDADVLTLDLLEKIYERYKDDIPKIKEDILKEEPDLSEQEVTDAVQEELIDKWCTDHAEMPDHVIICVPKTVYDIDEFIRTRLDEMAVQWGINIDSKTVKYEDLNWNPTDFEGHYNESMALWKEIDELDPRFTECMKPFYPVFTAKTMELAKLIIEVLKERQELRKNKEA